MHATRKRTLTPTPRPQFVNRLSTRRVIVHSRQVPAKTSMVFNACLIQLNPFNTPSCGKDTQRRCQCIRSLCASFWLHREVERQGHKAPRKTNHSEPIVHQLRHLACEATAEIGHLADGGALHWTKLRT